jgi:hypothetical protein
MLHNPSYSLCPQSLFMAAVSRRTKRSPHRHVVDCCDAVRPTVLIQVLRVVTLHSL